MRLVPQHEGLGLALADGLARCGRHDEARAQLSHLIEQAGWRRTRKRAHLHQRMAEIARVQGETAAGAGRVRAGLLHGRLEPAILTQLAEVAEATGDLERAERAYRTLLVQTREDAAPAARGPRRGLALTEILLRSTGWRASATTRPRRTSCSTRPCRRRSGSRAGVAAATRPAEAGAHDELARLFEKRIARAAGTPAEAEISPRWRRACARRANRRRRSTRSCGRWRRRPRLAHLHAPLAELARACGRWQPLVDRLLALVERRRRKADMGLASTLLLLAAEIAERDFDDQTRALELHHRAEEMQPRSLDVLSGIARLAQQQGNVAECDRVAGMLKLAAAEARSPEAAAEALYRAAAVELGRAETRETGIADLCEALEKSRDVERAAALVAGAGVPDADLVKILPLYERIARQSGDESCCSTISSGG